MTPGRDSGLPESVPETVHVTVLGPPVIRTHLGDTRPLERKVAALLTFVALEGEQTRSVLAGLLWPDVTEHAARNNLRQTLYRLRGLTGDILSPGERVRLLPVVTVDVTALELAAFEGRAADVLHFGHDLLSGLDYDDCPDLQDWLLAQRERLRNVQQDAQLTLMRAAEARGELHAALAAAEGLLLLEPVSEFAYRSVMDLHHRLGDRGAALRAYARCREVLQRELGVEPMPQTVALAQVITRDTDSRTPERASPRPSPAAQGSPGGWLEPFVPLVGRSAALREVRAALEAGRRVYLVGPAGSGKTRLALDALDTLARAHGTRVRTVTGRPGDDAFPYATLARAVRELRRSHPGLPLPGWVDAEIARLQPERSPAPPPLVTHEDRLRFSEAVAALYAHVAAAGDTLLFLDDVHFMDTSSWEIWQYVLGHPDIRSGARAVLAYRPAELPPERLAALRAAARAREASAVTLEPLTDEDVHVLMRHLAPDAPHTFVHDLARSTGGLPLTLLETLRALREAGALTRGWPAHLPHLPGLQALMTRRLEALGGDALRLARIAAVAGPAFSAELAADVLGTHPVDLGPPWTELVQARVLSVPGSPSPFTHDLLAQATLQALPAPITALLHGRVAAALERRAAHDDPGRLARHWALAGNVARAAQWHVQAARTYHANGAVMAAADAYRQALHAGLTPEEQVAARRALGVTLTDFDPALAEHELQLAQTQARALRLTLDLSLGAAALAELRRKQGRLLEGLQAIGDALRTLPEDAAPAVRAGLWRARFWLHLRAAQVPDAETAIGEALRHAPGDLDLENERALLLWHTGRGPEAVEAYEALLRAVPPGAPSGFENNLAWTYWTLGRNAEAAELLERLLAAPSSPYSQGLYRANLSTVLTSLGQSRRALHELRLARPLLERYPLHLTDVHHRTSIVHYRAGRDQAALMSLEAALPLAREVNDPYRLAFVLASLAATLARRGHTDAALPLALEAQTLAARTGYPLVDCVTAQALSVVNIHSQGGPATGGAAERHAEAAASIARACSMPEQLAHALLLQAQATTRASWRQALQREALHLGQTHDFPDVTWRAAAALTPAEPDLRAVAQTALHRLREAAPDGWYRT